MTRLTDEDILALGDGTYFNIKTFADGEKAWLARMVFTCAILYGAETWGHRDRWCYRTMAEARRALAEWDGAPGTEPKGWHRHPASGRRINEETGEMYVCP